jgi:hypothetical protein
MEFKPDNMGGEAQQKKDPKPKPKKPVEKKAPKK